MSQTTKSQRKRNNRRGKNEEAIGSNKDVPKTMDMTLSNNSDVVPMLDGTKNAGMAETWQIDEATTGIASGFTNPGSLKINSPGILNPAATPVAVQPFFRPFLNSEAIGGDWIRSAGTPAPRTGMVDKLGINYEMTRSNSLRPEINSSVSRGLPSVFNSYEGNGIQVSMENINSRLSNARKFTPFHHSPKALSNSKLPEAYESEDSEFDTSEKIYPKESTNKLSSKRGAQEQRRATKEKYSNFDSHSSSSSSSSSSDNSSSSDSESSYLASRGKKYNEHHKLRKGKRSKSKHSRRKSDDSNSSDSEPSSYSKSSFSSGDHKKRKSKSRGFSRSSSRYHHSNDNREFGAVRYIQTEPKEFLELKLEKLTVDDAVKFLERYNNLCSVHNQLVPHISRFIPLNIQQALVSAKAARKGRFYKSYDGLYDLSTKEVLSMIHHAVIAAEVSNKKQYLEQLKRARFPMDILGKDYQPTASNFKLMRDALAKFQMVFVTRWKFLKERTPKSFHLSLQKRQHEVGMIQVFTEIIPFGIGKAILENIPLKKVKDCGNNFEQFLREFFDQVEYLMDCHRKAQFLNSIVYSERNQEDREARRTRIQMLDDHLSDIDDDESEQHIEVDFDEQIYALTQAGHSSVPGKLIKSQLENEKSPGGCIQLVQLGSCKRPGCKYVHNDPSVLQATWWHYARRLFDSPYRVSKAKVLEVYKDLPTKVTLLTRAVSTPNSIPTMPENAQCLDDPLFEDSPRVVEMLMKSAFPDVDYIDKIHRSGEVLPYGHSPITIGKALFDTGALSANYISQELVNRYRASLGSCIRQVRGHVCLGDNETTVEVSETLVATVQFIGRGGILHSAELKFVVFSMPGLDMIIGLKDIVRNFKTLFEEMLEDVQTNLVSE